MLAAVHRRARNRDHADPPPALGDARNPFEFHRGDPASPAVEAAEPGALTSRPGRLERFAPTATSGRRQP